MIKSFSYFLSPSLITEYSETRVKIFIGKIEGPNAFICERYKMLLLGAMEV